MSNIPEESRNLGRALAISVLVALVVTGLGFYWALALDLGPIDDAFISLRYANNWASGRGLAFNPGERVEGYTNFLLVAAQACLIKAGARPEWVLVALGWISFAMLAGLQTLALSRLVLPGRPVLAGLGGLVLGLSPMLICWAASGMETCLFTALVLASFLFLVAGPSSRSCTVSAMILALAAMTRPEAVALVPAALLVAWFRYRDPKQPGRLLVWFVVPYGIYFVIRWWHFGFLLPNTFYAKLDFGSQVLWQRGILYVWDFLRAAPLVTLSAALGIALVWRAPLWVKAWTVVLLSQLVVVIYEGGDHFAMFRFLVPTVPFLGMLALYVPVAGLRSRLRAGRARSTLLAVCIGLVFLSGVGVGRVQKRDELEGMRHLQRFRLESLMARSWGSMGAWLHANSPKDASVATVAIGAIGFYSDLEILDPFGLTDPEIAHREIEIGAGYAGHEKFDVDSVFAKHPTYLLLANQLTSRPIPEGDLAGRSWGDFNQAMLADPRLTDLYRFSPVEIAPGRWMNLHVAR